MLLSQPPTFTLPDTWTLTQQGPIIVTPVNVEVSARFGVTRPCDGDLWLACYNPSLTVEHNFKSNSVQKRTLRV